MRILHISETDSEGGAGRAGHTLHTALRRQGIESFFLTECARTDDPWTFTFSGHRGMVAKGLRHLRATLDLLPLRRYPRRQTGAWSIGWLPRRLPPLVRRLRPDIIHLHWISQALPVQAVGRLPGPIVWTHHDWGAFTGGCRCPVACRRFTVGCGDCPQLGSHRQEDLSQRSCQRKLRAWRALDIHSVAVGSGIAKDVGDSLILGRHPCTVIPNGIDTDVFRPQDRLQTRATLNLDPRELIFLFGAFTVDTPLKGGRLLVEALSIWHQRHPSIPARLLTVGRGAIPGTPAGMPVTALGLISNPERLAFVYAAADVVVVPSRVESFGLMAAEAQACGVPVVAFAETGARNIVIHRETGFLASDWKPEPFAAGLDWATSLSESERGQAAEKSRRHARDMFSLPAVTQEHLNLYHTLVEENT